MHTPASRALKLLMKRFEIKSEGELSRLTKMKQPTIHRILTGESKDPSTASLTKLSKFFGVDIGVFTGSSPIDTDSNVTATDKMSSRLLPVISWAAAITFIDSADPFNKNHSDEPIPPPFIPSDHDFCLRVEGISNTNPSGVTYPDNSVIFVRTDKEPKNKDCIIYHQHGDDMVTFKQLIIENKKTYVRYLNPNWPEPIIELSESVRIIGVVDRMYIMSN